jgi:large subunit ribosomal protein L34e
MTRRKTYKKLPGGKTVIKIVQRTPSKPRCATSGQILHGVARGSNTARKKMSKSSKRPQRPYGGVYSSKVSRLILKQRIREEQE